MIFCSTSIKLKDIGLLSNNNINRITFITRFGWFDNDFRINLIIDYPGIKENDTIIVKFKSQNKWSMIKFYPSIRVRKLGYQCIHWGENVSVIMELASPVANSFMTRDWDYLETFRYLYEPDLEAKENIILWMA